MKIYILELSIEQSNDSLQVDDIASELEGNHFASLEKAKEAVTAKGLDKFLLHTLSEFTSSVNNGNDCLGESFLSYIEIA